VPPVPPPPVPPATPPPVPPVPPPPVKPPEHTPNEQLSALPHLTQAKPPRPQESLTVPGRHTPAASQHPAEQVEGPQGGVVVPHPASNRMNAVNQPRMKVWKPWPSPLGDALASKVTCAEELTLRKGTKLLMALHR
jgi:hypothetical protein